MRQLLSYMAPYNGAFLIGIVCAVASVAIAVIGPKITGDIITEIANGFMNKVQGIGGIDFDAIQKTCAILLAIYALARAWNTRKASLWRRCRTRSGIGCVVR